MAEKIQDENYNQNLLNLAQKLFINHLQISLDEEVLNRVIKGPRRTQLKSKRTVIAIIGAGASIQAGLPDSLTAIKELKKSLNVQDDFLERELDRLASVYRLERDTFETNLLAFSRYDSEGLRENIHKFYFHRYPPILCYEILAHLLKHRFIDAIINFNFDELLDQSIDDELGDGEYYKIVSDGDCPEILLDQNLFYEIGYRSDLPVYIKPHGTASHKSTLRFTRGHYYGLPIDIRNLLKNIMLSPNRQLVILSIGFNMQSFEFNSILKNKGSEIEIYYINKEEPKPDPALPCINVSHLIKVRDGESLNKSMEDLCLAIYNNYKGLCSVRGIARHVFICGMLNTYICDDFKTNKNNTPSRKKDYYERRSRLELLLSIVKSKGLINMSDLSNDRCGRYYDYYRKERTGLTVDTLSKLCNDFGFFETEYGYELLRWKEKNEFSFSETKLILSFDDITKWFNSIQSKLDIEKYASNKKLLYNQLREIYDAEDTEIFIKPKNFYNKIFKDPRILKTKTALKLSTLDLLNNKEWKKLLVVAETGAWFKETDVRKMIQNRAKSSKKLTLRFIVADLAHKEDLERIYKDLDISIKHLNWWEHNRHMTIFLKANNAPLGSIYFERRLRSPNITPIQTNSEDSEILLKMFCAYWEKTKNNNQRIVDYKKTQDIFEYLGSEILSR